MADYKRKEKKYFDTYRKLALSIRVLKIGSWPDLTD
jgi:hypothetical protein